MRRVEILFTSVMQPLGYALRLQVEQEPCECRVKGGEGDFCAAREGHRHTRYTARGSARSAVAGEAPRAGQCVAQDRHGVLGLSVAAEDRMRRADALREQGNVGILDPLRLVRYALVVQHDPADTPIIPTGKRTS